ncbi:MAG: pyridoxal-phosphate dependent enzyme [Bacteroidetes bacterium]|nr:pyridoxal-phosphate dependent enzyme [Bacteroidota bacterium]MBV6460790.1 L-threo-3-hydroxyaspartate ammonia-lyase [Flavobacteriales bacterium]WKZ75791.1 MAG: pyridoxal-phosphate dependent enzyme [Vicingaceae bacterium]MCL4816665.1 pyridoxal-phosphate dependent enzyme [Flavobacteriales bacterium]NOG95708.1 pyridoxal-phosphate dependent enzyme [Bacteroidota bacterium]
MNTIPTEKDILAAHQRIEKWIIKTPVLQNDFINKLIDATVFFKCENLQKIGAFKVRGAFNTVLQLSDKEKKNGVTTHSSGNHAQALALAANQLNIKAYIVMPKGSPTTKKKGVIELGAEIIECENSLQAREENLQKIVNKTGAAFIPPYNDYKVIAGQATAAKEFIEQTPSLDFILTPVGGGGLLSGTALSAKYFSAYTKVIGCEPENMNDAHRSILSGKIEVNLPDAFTIADGLRTTLGEKTFYIIKKNVNEIFTVQENEIIAAMQLIWERLKIIVEPSSAVPLAAVIKNKSMFSEKKVGIILSGGNVDLKNTPFF